MMVIPWWAKRSADKLNIIRKAQDEHIRLIQERPKEKSKQDAVEPLIKEAQSMPKVFNKRTDTIPPDAVYVGRPSKWGNDMTIRELKVLFPEDTKVELQIKAVGWFITYAKERLKIEPGWLEPLRGKDLVCWCAPLPCHADILLELANEGHMFHNGIEGH